MEGKEKTQHHIPKIVMKIHLLIHSHSAQNLATSLLSSIAHGSFLASELVIQNLPIYSFKNILMSFYYKTNQKSLIIYRIRDINLVLRRNWNKNVNYL